MGKVVEDVRLIIPKTDMRFFRQLADKMGWSFEVKEDYLKGYTASRPKNVKLSDAEILSEVETVRHGK